MPRPGAAAKESIVWDSKAESTKGFHPAVRSWLLGSFESPTPPQEAAWPKILRGEHVLVAAPTGSGKTLSAFLCAIDGLVREAQTSTLPEETRVLYVSPLKALTSDVEKNLKRPLDGIRARLVELGNSDAPITTAVRTGDTLAKDRAAHTKRPAHIYVTTPESLFILLTSDSGRRMLSTVRTVIIDEIHALIRDKRGAHLALSLERLDSLLLENGRERAQRIGLSATQKPIERVAEFLVGFDTTPAGPRPRPCEIVDTGHQRAMDLSLVVPGSPLEGVMSAECWTELYDELASLIRSHRTTLIFTNTRRLAERLTRFLAERLGEEKVSSHHGSLSRKRRQAAEQALKEGRLSALVATASLELGIDVGEIDLVCQISSPGSISTLLQRVGRSGHFVGGLPKGRLFPLSRDDLVESIALLQAAKRGELDEVKPPEAPLDILAQQIVATVAPAEMKQDELLALIRRAAPYRALPENKYLAVLDMLANGYATSRGRRGAYVHHDQVNGRIKGRRGARLSAITNGGAIPDNFDYEVLLSPADTRVGSVHEDFAIESMPGDIFQLGNTSYQILKVDPGIVRVADAHGQPPTIPFWVGEAPSRTDELSAAVSRFREEVVDSMDQEPRELIDALIRDLGIPERAAVQAVEYLRATYRALGHMPTQKRIVAERFFDETEGMHVVIHSPFGSRQNRAFGLALRKRFCRSFNVELQAAAGEDALVLSLGPMHSFPLETIFQFLKSNSVRDVLTQALLDAPLFQTRWRWNASRALAILRFRGGKKVPPRFQRMQSDDLLALCFPDQVACLENIAGDRQIPEHPLVEQTIVDSLTEAMDVDALEKVLRLIEAGEVACIARDLTEPSPLSHEILTARPYAFLDDAPLEERRTQAVQMRRFTDPQSTDDFGRLDPAAIEQVVAEARPEPRDADELHDALLVFAALPEEEVPWKALPESLLGQGRAFWVGQPGERLLFATERQHLAKAVFPELAFSAPPLPAGIQVTLDGAAAGVTELLRGRLEFVGPTTAPELSQTLRLKRETVAVGLAALEAEGFILRGRFRSAEQEEFCERRLLARIHRLTLHRLRREIEPVTAAEFLDFLTHYQCVHSESRKEGPLGTLAVLEQLSGYAAAASSWEADLLPTRVRLYQPGHLDHLCISGQVMWSVARRRGMALPSDEGRPRLRRSTPLRILPRQDQDLWTSAHEDGATPPALHPDSERLAAALKAGGALFFNDIPRRAQLLPSQAEHALSELIGAGLCTTDTFAGVRVLLTPENKRGGQRHPARGRRRNEPSRGLETAGRISWLGASDSVAEKRTLLLDEARTEAIAWQLLARFGVVFRKVLEREQELPPWGDLLRVYHRLEARGEIRGGRFVHGFSGEQFATSEAISLLRRVRRNGPSQELIRVSATDPLNLLGILTPGKRLPSSAKNQLVLRGGTPLATLESGEVQLLTEQDPTSANRGLTLTEAKRILLGPNRAAAAAEIGRLSAE
jgi:ATP-dependent Lhr-like helicase